MSNYYPLSQIKTNLYTKGDEYFISLMGKNLLEKPLMIFLLIYYYPLKKKMIMMNLITIKLKINNHTG